MPPRSRRPRSSFLGRITRPILSLALLAAGLVLAGAFVGIAVQGSAVDRERVSLAAQIAQLERERAAKEAEVERRKTEEYVVDTARDYGYVRPGEGLIAVEGGQPRQGVLVDIPAVDLDRIARWLAVFFGPR